MRRLWHIFRWTAVAAGLVCGVVVVGAVLSCYSEMHQAAKFLQDVMQIQSQTQGPDVLRMLFERYGSHFYPGPPYPTGCSYGFVFSNRAMARLRLARRVYVGGALTFREGRVSVIAIDYTTTLKDFQPSVHITKFLQPLDRGKQYYAATNTDYGIDKIVFIDLRSPTEAQQTFVVSSLDLHCLVKFGGCSSTKELSPALYQAASAPHPQQQ